MNRWPHRRQRPSARDAKVIALIAAAHFTSHVHLMLLPPIFGLVTRGLRRRATSRSALALTAYNVASALLQTPAGFLVDRIGPRAMLTGGLLLARRRSAIAALLPGYMAVRGRPTRFLGLANTVYHPADYSILAATIDAKRIGKAFSIHNFSGYLGIGVTPAMVLASAALWGWQGAFLLRGGAGDRRGAAADRGRRRPAAHASRGCSPPKRRAKQRHQASASTCC